MQGYFSISRPWMAAKISIRLLVVNRKPPLTSPRFYDAPEPLRNMRAFRQDAAG
jgi:hypothetical protein